MNKPISPCNPTGAHDCELRRVGCRGSCEKWQKFEKAQDEFREWKLNYWKENDPYKGYKKDCITKQIRKDFQERR